MPERSEPIRFEGRLRRLEWDEAKRQSNLLKHGIDFQQLEATLTNTYVLDFDADHSETEDRWRLLGLIRDRVAAVTIRIDIDSVRIISARFANDEETAAYFDRCFGRLR
jgi:uncharacterized protein